MYIKNPNKIYSMFQSEHLSINTTQKQHTIYSIMVMQLGIGIGHVTTSRTKRE